MKATFAWVKKYAAATIRIRDNRPYRMVVFLISSFIFQLVLRNLIVITAEL